MILSGLVTRSLAHILLNHFRADVVLTDLPEMVPLIKRNVTKNKESLKGQAEVKAFEWGSDISLLNHEDHQGFDMVLAADCIYYKEVTTH